MKSLPPVLIVTDRGRLVAFRTADGEKLQRIASVEFEEGNSKLSELVTDQAGAFPNTGSTGTSAAERMPLVAEIEVRCFRKIVDTIHGILAAEKPRWWGLAAPSEIHGALVDFLDPADRECLSRQVRKDLVNSSMDHIDAAFRGVPGEEA
jgi:hypothetical protein